MKGRERKMATVGSFLPGRQGSAPQVWKEPSTPSKELTFQLEISTVAAKSLVQF